MSPYRTLCAVIILAAFFAVPASAQISRTISYQGVLADQAGVPISGSHSLQLALYDNATGGIPLWSETQNVTVNKGLFDLIMGTVTPIPASLLFDHPYFLGITVDGGAELAARTPMTAVPYALRAVIADQALALAPGATGVVTSLNSVSGAITLQGGGGTTVSSSNNVITISSTGGGGGSGIQGVQNTDGSLVIAAPNGPVATIGIADNGVTTAKIADKAVGPAKVSPTGAITGQAITFDGSNVVWGTPSASLTLPFSGTTALGSNAFAVENNGSGNGILGRNTSVTGMSSGVRGEVISTSNGTGAVAGASGLFGYVNTAAPGSFSAGVRGVNSGTGANGIGTIGYQAGSGTGVYGETPSGIGVYGIATNITANNTGLLGETSSPNGRGVEARYSGAGVGITLELNNGPLKVSGANPAAFVHTATVANKITTSSTEITNPLCDGDPNVILIVNNRGVNVAGGGTIFNRAPLGSWYDPARGKWQILNVNQSTLTTGSEFNVLVIKR